MANVLFGGSESSETDKHTITAFHNWDNDIFIGIDYPESHQPSFICLDIETAIQFSKQLRKSIAYAKAVKGEVNSID